MSILLWLISVFSLFPAEGKMLTLITSVLTLGTLTHAILALAAIVAYLITLALLTLDEICANSAEWYICSDSLVKLLLLCMVGYVLIKLLRRSRIRFLHHTHTEVDHVQQPRTRSVSAALAGRRLSAAPAWGADPALVSGGIGGGLQYLLASGPRPGQDAHCDCPDCGAGGDYRQRSQSGLHCFE